MSRWSPDARERLEAAAFELFERQGFAATTVPQIAERAGLTTRTFFRHFADKREVLYADDAVPTLARELLEAAPSDADPLRLVADVVRRFGETELEPQREKVLRRSAIVASDPGLQERSLRKRAGLASAVRDCFRQRDVPERTAAVLAETAASLFELSLVEWMAEDDPRPLGEIFDEHLAALRAALETD